MTLDRTRGCPAKDRNGCSVALNQPRYMTLLDDSKITVKCVQYGFVEVILFKKGRWKLLLTQQDGELSLQKGLI